MTAITTDLTSGYTPPGVYIAEESNPISTATGLPPGRLTIIGRGQGSQQSTEQVILTSDGYRLSQRGIDVDQVSVTVVSDDSVLAAGNYTLTQEPQSNEVGDYFVRIARVSEGTAPEGTAVWVSYQYKPIGYDRPRIFTSPSDVQGIYGPAMTSGVDPSTPGYNPINSPLTLAAEIAFANGAGEIMVVPLDIPASASSEAVKSALLAGYSAISGDYSSTIVVPLTDGLDAGDAVSAASDLRGHVASASASGYYRVGIYGPPLTFTESPVTIVQAGATYSRLILAYASAEGMIYRSNATGQRVTLGHQYLAAAYGGRMAADPVQQSLTRRVVAGFVDIAGTLNFTTKNTYSAAGVALTERDRSGRIIIRHGTSTDRSNLVASEPSVTRARDIMVGLIQTGLDNSDLIGSPMDENTPMSVKSIVAGVLEYCDANNVIVAYDNLQVRVQSLNPSVVEVRFQYRPSFPLNYIMVNFAIDLNTGLTEDLDDTTGTGV